MSILTAEEGAIVLRCEVDDPAMVQLLPAVDAYVKRATGRDWSRDDPIQEEAKSAARILLVLWHENPSMIGNQVGTLGPGLSACLTQLEAMACLYHDFLGRNGAGYVFIPGLEKADVVESLIAIIGDDGDQSNAFETIVSRDNYLLQTSTSDLSEIKFRLKIASGEDL